MIKSLCLPIDPSARAKIPGTKLVRIRDTETHLIETHAVSIGEGEVLHLELLRSIKMPKGDFLVARVQEPGEEGKAYWSFREERFVGLGKVHFDPEIKEHFILLINNKPDPRRPVIERIISLTDLPRTTRSKMGEAGDIVYVGGKFDLLKLLQVKERIARELKIGYVVTKSEQSLREAMRKRQVDQEAELKSQQAAAAQARHEAREVYKQKILSRPTITVWTAKGEKRWGIPVVGDDWKLFRNNFGVVLVEQYPTNPIVPIEAFFVEKTQGGRCGKRNAKPVTFERPVRQTAEAQPAYQFKGGFLINKDGQDIFVLEADKTNFDLMIKSGMNNDTLVALEGDPDKDGRRQVHQFGSDGVRVIGMYQPL